MRPRGLNIVGWAVSSLILVHISSYPVFIQALSRTLQQKQTRHVKIGGLFPIYKTNAADYARDASGIMRFAAMRMAISEINANSSLLPNTELKYSVQDSKRDEGRAFFSAVTLADWGSSVVIGAASSGPSMNAQLVLREYEIPQISYASTSAALSDKQTYPFFSRTPPTDALQAQGQVALVQYYNWTRVATFSSTDGYGAAGIDVFHRSAEKAGIQVLAQMRFPKNMKNFTELLQDAKDSRARIFVMFCSATDAARLLEQAFFAGLTGNGIVWIGSDSVSKVATWENMSSAVSEEQRMKIMRGFLGMVPYPGDGTPEYQAFVQRWVQQEPTLVAGMCSNETDSAGASVWRRSDVDGLRSMGEYDACAGLEEFSAELDSYSPYSYDAVYLAAHALHHLIEIEGKGSVEEDGQVVLPGWELLAAIRNQSFLGVTGVVQLDSLGNRIAGVRYKVVNHAGTSSGLSTVGQWDVTDGYTLCDPSASQDCLPVTWSNEGTNVPVDMLEWTVCRPGSAIHSIRDEDQPGAHRCTPCPAGYYSLGGDTINIQAGCTPCPRGTFAPNNGSTECLSCDVLGAEYYQDLEGQTTCQQCPENSERRAPSDGDSLAECLCRVQFHQPQGLPNGAKCVECPVGGRCVGFQATNGTTATNVTPTTTSTTTTTTTTNNNAPAMPDVEFWGDPSFPTQFFECEEGRCEFGYKCATGYAGRLCFTTEDGYGNIGGFVWKCPDGKQSLNATLGTVAMSLLVLLVFFFVNGVLCDFESIDVFLKNVRVLAVASLYSLRWHKNLEHVLIFFKFAMFDVDIAQPNCIMYWSYYESFFLQLILPTFMAFVYLVPVAFTAIRTRIGTPVSWSYILYHESSEVAAQLNDAISNIVNISQIFYPTILLMLIASFKCTRSSDDKHYLDIDPTFECHTSEHVLLQVISGLVLPVVLVMPLVALGFLLRSLRQDTLHTPVVLQRYGGLYRRYRIDYLWWEPLYLLKVTLLVAFQVFLVNQPMGQAFCALLVNSVALAAHYYAKPFVKSRSNTLEAAMLFMSSVFIASGNLFYTSSFGKDNHYTLSIGLVVMLSLDLALAVGIAAENVREDLARSFSSKLVKRLSQEMVDKREAGAVEGLESRRLTKAILALEHVRASGGTHLKPLRTGFGAQLSTLKKITVEAIAQITPRFSEASRFTPRSSGHSKKASENCTPVADPHQTPFTEACSPEAIPEPDPHPVPNNGTKWNRFRKPEQTEVENNHCLDSVLHHAVEEVQNIATAFSSLEADEVSKTLQGQALKHWLVSSMDSLTIQDMDHVLAVDEWVAPFVADDSHTSMYSKASTADFWRNMERALPDLMEWLSDAEEEQVERMRTVLDTLCASGVHSTSSQGGHRRKDYIHLIVEEDRSSIMYWLCHARHNQRQAFFALLNKIVKSKGIDTSRPGFKGSSSVIKSASSQKLLMRQIEGSLGSLTSVFNSNRLSGKKVFPEFRSVNDDTVEDRCDIVSA